MTKSIRLRRLGVFIAGATAAALSAGCVTQHGVATQDAIDQAVREAVASRPEPVVVAPRPEPPPLP